MRIGLYTPYLDTLTGGELYMLTIAEFLSKDNEVSVFWDDKEILNKASQRFNLNLNRVKLVQDIFSEGFSAKEKLLRTLKYDRIIYLSDGSLPLLFPKKLIVHFQAPLLSKNIPSAEKKKTFLIRKAFCNSKFTKSYIDKAFNLNSKVLYPPVRSVEGSSKKEKFILTVGRYQPYENGTDFKKIGVLIDVFKKFHENNKDWKMKIVTSVKQKDEEEFNKKIKSKIDNSIEIIKNGEFDDIQNAYKKSMIYWHAAGYGEDMESHPERAEHFGMSTVEAMTAGCVPVVINLGGQKEIIENSENGFLWNTKEELLSITQRLSKSEDEVKRISKNALKISQEYSKERFCEELTKII